MTFLPRFKKGRAEATTFAPVSGGFLRLIYDGDGLIENASFVKSRGGRACGCQLYFDWTNESVTYKTESGLSGQQWCGGTVRFGTVYDDDSGDPDPGRRIGFKAWVDECVADMIKNGGGPTGRATRSTGRKA
jgi:hypothetical protein